MPSRLGQHVSIFFWLDKKKPYPLSSHDWLMSIQQSTTGELVTIQNHQPELRRREQLPAPIYVEHRPSYRLPEDDHTKYTTAPETKCNH